MPLAGAPLPGRRAVPLWYSFHAKEAFGYSSKENLGSD